MTKIPKRKRTRLRGYDYNSPGAYHLILCSNEHKLLFSKIHKQTYEITLTKYGNIIDETIQFLNKLDGQSIANYVIMPNHIHIILIIEENNEKRKTQNSKVSTFVNSLKRFTNKKSKINLWQRSFYDSIIEKEEDFYEVWRYIDENPIKWSLDEYYKE